MGKLMLHDRPYSGGQPTHIYSTDEHKVGVWIDGSTIYEKTYTRDITNPSNPYTEEIDITGLNIINLTKHYAKYIYQNNWYYMYGDELNYSNSTYLNIQPKNETNTTLTISCAIGNISRLLISFTLQYTKS